MKNFLFWKTKNFEEITDSGHGAPDSDRLRPIKEFKLVYHRPIYIGFKEFIKKIFLKLLKKIFPSKHLLYKNKIKSVILKFRVKILGSNIGVDRYLYLLLQHFFIRIKYFHRYKLPYNHLYAFHTVNKFLKVLELEKIDFFILGGALLGAVRPEQGNIAGSAGDIDLGIKEDQLPKLINSIPLLKKKGVEWIRQWPNTRCERLQFFFINQLVDVGVYRKKIINKKEMWIGETEKLYCQKFCGITLSVSDLEFLKPLNLYGKPFLAPRNPRAYLEQKYGKNWRIPDKRQYFLNEKKFK